MLIKELRVTLPCTVDEYQCAQLWTVAEMSKNETGGGEGVEVLANEPYKGEPLFDGQYCEGQFTHKIYHLSSKVPGFIRMLAPKGALEMHEEAWNAYPYCKTVISNPDYMKNNFFIKIETIHLPDRGNTENAHMLPSNMLKEREVIHVDIVNDALSDKDYVAAYDPTRWHSTKANRGPLTGNDWTATADPVMTCYKLVTCEFKWWGLQTRVESFIQKQYPRLFNTFHRQLTCTMDDWFGLSMDDIRRIEEATKIELDKQRAEGEARGTTAE